MTNISFQVSCITGSPPRGTRTDYDKGGVSSLSENGGSVTCMESQEKAGPRGRPDLWYSHLFATFPTRLLTKAFCFRMINLIGCLQVCEPVAESKNKYRRRKQDSPSPAVHFFAGWCREQPPKCLTVPP